MNINNDKFVKYLIKQINIIKQEINLDLLKESIAKLDTIEKLLETMEEDN